MAIYDAQQAAREYMARRTLQDMLARGITLPQGGPLLSAQAQAQAQAPPYYNPAITPWNNPTMAPPTASPIEGRPTPSPVPAMPELPQPSGAATSPILSRSRGQRFADVMASPQATAFMQAMGQSLAGPRMPGESTFQQVVRSIGQGTGGVQSVQAQRQQQALLDWQRTMAEREQGTREATATSESEHRKATAATNRRAVDVQAEQSARSAELREREITSESEWRNRQLNIQAANVAGDLEKSKKLVAIEEQRLQLDRERLDEAKTQGTAERDIAGQRLQLTKRELELSAARIGLERMRLEREAKDQSLTPEERLVFTTAIGDLKEQQDKLLFMTKEQQEKYVKSGAVTPAAAVSRARDVLGAVRKTEPTTRREGTLAPAPTPKKGETRQYMGATYVFDGTDWRRQ